MKSLEHAQICGLFFKGAPTCPFMLPQGDDPSNALHLPKWVRQLTYSSWLMSEHRRSAHSTLPKLLCIPFDTHLWKINAPSIHTARTNDLFRCTRLSSAPPADRGPGLAAIDVPLFSPPPTPAFPSLDGDADAVAAALAPGRW